jgi:mRNA-degrading endonuclease toxin of MazEF toxin-antitoxin module
VIGTPEHLAAYAGADSALAESSARYPAGARGAGRADAVDRETYGGHAGLFGLLRSVLAELDGPLRLTLAVLMALAGLSVVLLRIGYVKPGGGSMSLLDAAYFTVETIGTIGYGDFSFAAQPSWLRVYAVIFMLLGVGLAAILFAQVTELLVSGRVARSHQHRRVRAMRQHMIVVGLGAVGVRVVEGLLAAGRRVVVIERDEGNRYLERVRALGVPVVHGDATDASVLTEVNLPASAAIAVLTSDDLVNIETGLAVRGQLGDYWKHVPVVLRVFDRELGEVVGDGFDFRWVRSTAALAAPWFVGAALGLDVLGTFYVGRVPFMIGRITVGAGSGLDGLAMGELSARTRVVAIDRAPTGTASRVLEHPPRSGTRFSAGDDAYLVGPYEELLAVLRRDALAPGRLTARSPSVTDSAGQDG